MDVFSKMISIIIMIIIVIMIVIVIMKKTFTFSLLVHLVCVVHVVLFFFACRQLVGFWRTFGFDTSFRHCVETPLPRSPMCLCAG